MNNKLYEYFEKDKDFREYVTKCMRTYGKELTEMLDSPITEEYYKSLIKGGCNHKEIKE